MVIHQLCFEFHFPVERPHKARQRADWRIRHLARLHRIPAIHAAVYALEMRLPAGEVR
jgi:hypothetical protein